MAITNVQVAGLQVGSFSNQFIGGTLDIPTFVQGLTNLDVTNAAACQAQVKRCNNRCSGNTTAVAVAFVGGKVGTAAESFQVQFTINSN